MASIVVNSETVTMAMERWPLLGNVWGCVNCRLLFGRTSTEIDEKGPPNNSRCPSCGSQSVLDLTAKLDEEQQGQGQKQEQGGKQ